MNAVCLPIVERTAESHCLGIVAVDLATDKCRVTGADKLFEAVEGSRFLDGIVIMMNHSTFYIYHLDQSDSWEQREFRVSDTMIILNIDYRDFSSPQSEFQLAEVYGVILKIYQDQYIHMKSSNTGRYVCVMHHDTRQLYLMDTKSIKPEDKFIDIGIKYPPLQTLMLERRFVFASDDSKLLIAVKDPLPHLFDRGCRRLQLLVSRPSPCPSTNAARTTSCGTNRP